MQVLPGKTETEAGAPTMKPFQKCCIMLIYALPCFTFLSLLGAQENPSLEKAAIVVGIHTYPPFTMDREEDYFGFDIDYAKALADRMGRPISFQHYPSIQALLDATTQSKVDMAMGGITLTARRERQLDFAHAYYLSGLDIMIPFMKRNFTQSLLGAITNRAILYTVGAFLAFIIFAGFIFWWCERKVMQQDGVFKNGLENGMWLAYATATTIGFGDITPKSLLGRLATVPISLIGFIVIGSISGVVASLMTMEQLQANINGLPDLSGKKVAIKEGTAMENRIREYGVIHSFTVIPVSDGPTAYEYLEAQSVDAYINDAPGLLFYSNGEGRGKVSVVGRLFENQFYCIATPQKSSLLEEIKQTQLELREIGFLEKLKLRYGI